MLTLRTPRDDDWPAILAAANASAPDRAAENEGWLANRRNFPATERGRRHYVLDDGTNVVGYGAVEETRDAEFRVFIVTSDDVLTGTGSTLIERLMDDLRELGARRAWVREDAKDIALIEFFRAHGLGQRERRAAMGDRTIVLLERDF